MLEGIRSLVVTAALLVSLGLPPQSNSLADLRVTEKMSKEPPMERICYPKVMVTTQRNCGLQQRVVKEGIGGIGTLIESLHSSIV